MKKLNLLFCLFPLLCAACTGPNPNSGISLTSQSVNHRYEISQTSISLEVDQSKKLYVSDNGTITNNVTWSSDNTKVASVTSDGTVIAFKNGKANITATIDANNKLYCEVTVGSSASSSKHNDTAIVKFFKNNANYVDDDEIVYAFTSVKSRYDYVFEQTLIWELYFLYDTSDDTCIIKSKMNGTYSSGMKFYYYGYNTFYWGNYKGGLFTGGYCQETSVGSGAYATLDVEFDNSSLVFRTDHTLTMGYELSYSVTKNEFSDDESSDDVLRMFARVTECCSYAHEVFSNYESNLTLY